MIRIQRLRAAGQLSAGVSHNLNNILTGVLGPAELLKMHTEDAEILREVEDIITSATRARDLVRRLYQAVRSEENPMAEPVDVNTAVHEAIRAARPRWEDESEARDISIDLVTDLNAVPPAAGTRAEFHDILLNLLFNAVDALPCGGTLTIATQSVESGVQLEISDTSIGMDEETRRRAFEPFFTTKLDVGTGLGLSTVYGTVTRWGGSIDVESAPDKGATFTIRLPIWTEPEIEATPAKIHQARRGKVLVVEDEKIIRDVLVRLLSRKHEVEAIQSGSRALEAFSPGNYDVALIDLGMPGTPGDQVALKMRQADPSVTTVLITGWQLSEGDPRLSAFDFRIQKPFQDIQRVQDIVAQAVDLHDIRAGEGNLNR